MKRRHFLQASGTAVTTALIHQIIQQGDRAGKVLAQDTPRKLALLVGINEYCNYQSCGDRVNTLSGCLNDVALQKALLKHRFGFKESDILTITNQAATHQNILQAFEQHLIQQAKPGDVVLFHFSGHGARLISPNPIPNEYSSDVKQSLNSSFVTQDANSRNSDGSVNDITGNTLFLLMSALQTDAVTAVLDCCYSGGGTRGASRIRAARDGNGIDRPSPAELAYQQQWLRKLNLTPQQFRDRRIQDNAKGAVLAAAEKQQAAQDGIGNINAGAFTYLLTQYLWSNPTTFREAEASLKSLLLGTQEPVFDLHKGIDANPIYFTPGDRLAQAIVTEAQGNQVKLWLGGLEQASLEAILGAAQPQSEFAVLDETGQPIGTAKLKARGESDFSAIAVVDRPVKVGARLLESKRVLPQDLKLSIGIDPSLGTAATAISQINRVEAVPYQSQNLPYGKSVQYILSRVTPEYQKKFRIAAPVNSIALFSPSLELLPKSAGESGESVQSAVDRLNSTLQSLLVGLLVRKTLNASTSNLDVEAKIMTAQDREVAIATTRKGKYVVPKTGTIPINTLLQFQVKNNGDKPIYQLIAQIGTGGDVTVLFPNPYTTGDFATLTRIDSRNARTVPDPDQGDHFPLLSPDPGQVEVLIITSHAPLGELYGKLQTFASEQKQQKFLSTRDGINRGEDLFSALLGDLTRGESGKAAVDANEMATLSLPIEFVKG